MTEDNRKEKAKKFGEYLQSLSVGEKDMISELNIKQAKEEHERFKVSFQGRHCYICEKSLSSFYPETPCLHWLLRPSGFKKDDLPSVAEKFGFFQIETYLRWVANQESFAKNINELKDEGTGNKLFEITIKYKTFEWSLSCAENDYQGHQTSEHSKHPHYHFQMKINGQPFINYNDFHLPFNDMDIDYIENMNLKGLVRTFPGGEGISDILKPENLDVIVNSSLSTDSAEAAAFSLDTLILAEDGHKINGEDLYNIMQEAKEKGVTVASLTHKIPNATSRVIVSPGPGVVEQAPRTGRKKKDK